MPEEIRPCVVAFSRLSLKSIVAPFRKQLAALMCADLAVVSFGLECIWGPPSEGSVDGPLCDCCSSVTGPFHVCVVLSPKRK